jgi:ABC-type glycerol-3-phosphate transport system substrate-binding protein
MKKLCLLLAAVLMILVIETVFAGGGRQGGAGGTVAGPVTLRINDLTRNYESTMWYAKLQKDLNVEVEALSLEVEQLNLAIASGDLPDITILPPNSMSLIASIIQADAALDLSPYLESKLPNLLRPAYAPINKLMQELMGGPNRKLYFTAYGMSADNPEGGILPSRGFIVRWDYYKDIGAPPINNDDDYLAALKAMQAKYPLSRSGKKTYAIGVEKNFGDMGGYRAATTLGNVALNVWAFAGTRYATDVYTGRPVNGYTDVNRSMYWTDMRFYNKVYRTGLFDPDSFSMSFDEYKAKIADGVYMGLYYLQEELYEKEAALDTQTKAKYVPIPSTGAYAFANKIAAFGRFPQFGKLIPKNSKNQEKAMEVLNWLYDPDNSRVMYLGDRSVYWDYDANGKPYMLDKALEMMASTPMLPGLDTRDQHQINYADTALHPDGSYYNIMHEKEYKGRGLNPALQDFCNFYKVSYPAEAQYNLFKQGRVRDLSNDYGQNITSFMLMPTDIKRISDGVVQIFERAMPRLIQANSDAEFLQIQNQVLADARAAGEDTVWQWVTSEYVRLEKIIYPLFQQAKNEYIHK